MKALLIGFVASTALLVGSQADDAAQKKEKARLQGTWKVKRFETPKGEDEKFKDAVFVIGAENTIELQNAGETKKGTFKINPAAKPREIDITPDDGSNKVMQGIYQLEKNTLKICIDNGSGNPRPAEFAVKGGSGQVLFTLERAK